MTLDAIPPVLLVPFAVLAWAAYGIVRLYEHRADHAAEDAALGRMGDRAPRGAHDRRRAGRAVRLDRGQQSGQRSGLSCVHVVAQHAGRDECGCARGRGGVLLDPVADDRWAA